MTPTKVWVVIGGSFQDPPVIQQRTHESSSGSATGHSLNPITSIPKFQFLVTKQAKYFACYYSQALLTTVVF